MVSIREVRSLKIVPRFRSDFPEVDIIVAIAASITAPTLQRGVDLGTRTTAVDVEVEAIGSVVGLGYDLLPHRARPTAWWG